MKFFIFRYEMLHFHIYTRTKGAFNATNQIIFLKKAMINIYILNYLKELLRCISNPTKKILRYHVKENHLFYEYL